MVSMGLWMRTRTKGPIPGVRYQGSKDPWLRCDTLIGWDVVIGWVILIKLG
jgi:hypothetical protein